MLRQLILCLMVACLAHAMVATPPKSPPDETLTPKKLSENIEEARGDVRHLLESMDQLTAKVMHGDKTDQEWFGIMTHMADFMKDSHGFFIDTLMGVLHLGERMFVGDHGFQKVTRCNNLAKSTRAPGFGTEEFLPEVEIALAKDLLCFSNMLKEVSVMKVRHQGCIPSEDDVVDFISSTIMDLFRLRNDGELFYTSVAKVTEVYSAHVPKLHEHFINELSSKEEMVRQLIRALGKY